MGFWFGWSDPNHIEVRRSIMANFFVGIDRGKEGFMRTDFTTGAASTPAKEFEFRILDTITNRDEAVKALKAIEMYVTENLFTGAKR
jgi:hypothetical protein